MRKSLSILMGVIAGLLLSSCDRALIPDYDGQRRAILEKTKGKTIKNVQYTNGSTDTITFLYEDGSILTISTYNTTPSFLFNDFKGGISQR